MPNHALSHEECRARICACCGVKTPNKKMSSRQEELVKKHAHTEYDSSIISYPTGLCSACRANLYHCEKPGGLEGRSDPREKWKTFQLGNIPTSRNHDPQTCSLCKVVKQNPVGMKGDQSISPKVLLRGENKTLPPKKVSPKKICMKCKQTIGRGIPHPCTPSSVQKNIVDMISGQPSKGQEQIISESLKNIVPEKGSEPGGKMRLKGLRGGNSLTVTVGKPSEKPVSHILTREFIQKLQKKLNCSERKLLIMCKEFRNKGVKFEPNIREDIERLSHCLDDFYTLEKLDFKLKSNKAAETKVKLDLVYVKDPVKFIDYVIEERGLDKSKVLVRLGLDGGQGSFKVIASIFETDYDPEIMFSNEEPGNRFTGSKRMLVMAMSEGMEEIYSNLRIVVEKLQLNLLECVYACDLKLINTILGISSHSGKHACCYCEGEMNLKSGKLRT